MNKVIYLNSFNQVIFKITSLFYPVHFFANNINTLTGIKNNLCL